MNPSFAKYIETAKLLANERGLGWDLVCDTDGKVSKETRWNLTKLVNMMPPPTLWLGQIGVDPTSFEKLNEIRRMMKQAPLISRPMPQAWRDLFQAFLIEQLLIQKMKPGSAIRMATCIRQLAPVAGDTPPWAATPEQIQMAYNAVLLAANSGKLALDFATMVRKILDGQKLADTPALVRFCVPYATPEAQAATKQADAIRDRQNAHGSGGLRQSLNDRKAASKLPDERAFWELVRIVFTETPQSFSDAIRFAAIKVQILMGFRIGETALLPLEWKIWREYVDADGSPAGNRGGISRSLMIRHFAEKQDEIAQDAGRLSFYETTVHVPPMYEEALIETLDHVAMITAPFRDRLKRQTETDRIFPEYSEDALIPGWEMYVRMTGNAAFSDEEIPPKLIRRYRKSYDHNLLEKMRKTQICGKMPALSKYFTHPEHREIQIRDALGNPMSKPISWSAAYVRVGDAEKHIRSNRVTKLSDTAPSTLTDGTLIHPHELMFLMPVRNLIEGRNNGVLDTSLYSAIGRISTEDLMLALGGTENCDSLFQRYGQTKEDRALRLISHSLRHLQNAELFRLGVADTIITKKFNRRSVQQSYVYDHRSLVEDLANIDIPPEAEETLGDKALQVYRMIAANKARGPIADEFHRIQREYGDAEAFDYLNAEADGLHVTPYGFCISSFTSDPCPKHLECFNGCNHLARTEVAEEQVNLETMRDRFAKVIEKIKSTPEKQRNTGWNNQLDHAQTRYDNIVKALATEPGMQPFVDGPDLSLTAEKKFGGTILDTMKRVGSLDD